MQRKESLEVIVAIGDIILLESEESDKNPVGYVTKLTKYRVQLSMDDPYAPHSKMKRILHNLSDLKRWYDLRKFSRYEVLKSRFKTI